MVDQLVSNASLITLLLALLMKSDVLLNIIIRDSGRIKDKKLGSVGNLKIL